MPLNGLYYCYSSNIIQGLLIMLNEEFMSTFGDIIKFHRKKSGLNRIELAKLAQVGKTAIFDIEHSKKTTRLDTIIKILDVLNITIELKSPLLKNNRE